MLRKVGDLNYILSTPDRRSKIRLCHINAEAEKLVNKNFGNLNICLHSNFVCLFVYGARKCQGTVSDSLSCMAVRLGGGLNDSAKEGPG